MADAPFKNAVDGAFVFLPFVLQKFQLSASGIGEMVVFTRAVVECLRIGCDVPVLFEFFENRVECRFLDRGDELYRLANFVTVGILLAHDRQNEAFNEQRGEWIIHGIASSTNV